MKNTLFCEKLLALFAFQTIFCYIMISSDSQCGMEEAMTDLRRSRSFFSGRPWPNGRIPYEIHSSLRPNDLKTFQAALDDFHKYTCVKFTPKTKEDISYVTARINFKATKCGSAIFCHIKNHGSHYAEVASWCSYKWTWAHELSHSLCLGHEQGRADRNEFLSYDDCNDTSQITPIVKNQNLRGQIYDYNSVMHFSCYGGCYGRPKRDPKYVKHCGAEVSGFHHAGLSVLDIEKINEYYNCFDGCKRHRWYNVKNLNETQMKSVVNFGSRDGDEDPVYLCRGYVFGDIAVGWFRPQSKTCRISAQGQTFNVTEHIQVFALPNGSNKITRDSQPYRLYSNSDNATVDKYLALGRNVENKPIFAAVGRVELENGMSKTVVGKVNGKHVHFAYIPGNEDLHVLRKFDVVGCSDL